MAIELPDKPRITEVRWKRLNNAQVVQSPFSNTQVVVDWENGIREASVTIQLARGAEARAWRSFFLKLRPPVGTFLFPANILEDTRQNETGQKLIAGICKIKDDSPIGKQINVSGFVPETPLQLFGGDWISINNRLYEIEDDVDSDENGEVTVNVWPPLQLGDVSQNDIVEVIDPKGEFYVTSWPSEQYGVERLRGSFSMAIKEKR